MIIIYTILTLIICSCTLSSVWTPTKHPHIVSMMRSMSRLLGSVLSGISPAKWPYAINFLKSNIHTLECNAMRDVSVTWP